MRDCDNCARCGRDGCKSWDCDFVPRKEAIRAWKERHETTDRKDEPKTCDNCKLKGSTKWCNNQVVCKAYKIKDEPQTDCPWK